MPQVKKSVLVQYQPESLFQLVNEVEAYPKFMPWCASAQVQQQPPSAVRATLYIDFHGLKQHFTTENTVENQADGGRRLNMRLVQGPFRHLQGHWQFSPLGPNACKVEFVLHYDFSSKVLEKLVGPVFHKICTTMVDAFLQQARTLNLGATAAVPPTSEEPTP